MGYLKLALDDFPVDCQQKGHIKNGHAGTEISMMLGSMAITNQMGFVFIFSIVVDTFVVRTVLVPAMLSLNPRLNYWPSDMPEAKITWLK